MCVGQYLKSDFVYNRQTTFWIVVEFKLYIPIGRIVTLGVVDRILKIELLSKMSEKPVVLPDTFNGEGSWTKLKSHFLNVAQVNGWNDDAKVQWLRVWLVGRTQRNISRVSEELSFLDVIIALDEKFEPSSRQARFQAQLQARVKRSTEGWAEYADDLRELAERGFPYIQIARGAVSSSSLL